MKNKFLSVVIILLSGHTWAEPFEDAIAAENNVSDAAIFRDFLERNDIEQFATAH